ncbi:MAG: OmpA family protein [Bacteroidales bacterium]|nr:OmpA family protein [Candidatus Colicola caccequi]
MPSRRWFCKNIQTIKRIIYILLALFLLVGVEPQSSVVYAAQTTSAAAKAKAKAAAKRAKEREKAKKAKAKAKAKAAKARAKAKAKAAKAKAKLTQTKTKTQTITQTPTFVYDSLAAYPTDSARNYLGFYGNIGYSRHTFVQDGLTTQGFVGGGLGVGYKLRYKLFRMDIRLEAQYTGNHLTGHLTFLDPITSPAPSMVYRTQMHNIVEQQHVLSAAIPIMFGMESDKVYCLLGVRLSLPVWTEYHLSADITRSAADYRLIDDFSSMPWHQLYSNSTSESGELQLRFNPQIICEVGWNLDHLIQPRRAHYELGLFGQVGVRDYRSPSPSPSTSTSTLTSTSTSTLVPWMVGLRFGIYYDLGRKPKAKSSTNPLTNDQLPISNKDRCADGIRTADADGIRTDHTPYSISERSEQSILQTPVDTAVYQGQIVTTGQKIILQNVYFATDKTEVLPSSQPGLNDLYQMLHEYPYIRVKIVGHTDNTNTAEYNQRLSEGRAASVRKSMLKRGIEAWRLETEGKGLTEPIDTNDTPEGRQHNRRVEFIIIE